MKLRLDCHIPSLFGKVKRTDHACAQLFDASERGTLHWHELYLLYLNELGVIFPKRGWSLLRKVAKAARYSERLQSEM